MANDDSLAKNIIGEGEKFLRSLSPEDRIKVSKFQDVGEFLEFVKNRPDVLRPYSLWEEIKELNAPQALAQNSTEPQEDQEKQPERGDSHRRTVHYHPPINEEPEADEVSGSTKQTVVGQQTKDPTETEEIFIPVQEPGQRTVVTETRTSPAVATQARTGGYPNRRRGGFINRTNRIARRTRRARGGTKIASSAIKAAKTGRKIGSAIGIVTAMVSAIPLILIIVFVIIIGAAITDPVGFAGNGITSILPGSQGGSNATPTPNPGPGPGPGPRPVPSCSEVDARISQDFNGSIKEGAPPAWKCTSSGCGIRNPGPENQNCEARLGWWKILNKATEFGKFNQRLNDISWVTQTFSDPTLGLGGAGHVEDPDLQQFKNAAGLIKSNLDSAGFWIIHETTHMLQDRDRSLENGFDIDYFKNNGDRDCYNRYNFLISYDFIGTDPERESMADASALYIYNRSINNPGAINDFRTKCPATYNWIDSHLYRYINN